MFSKSTKLALQNEIRVIQLLV